MKVSKRQVSRLVSATFPEYAGRRFFLTVADSVQLHDLNWSGGTRVQYRAVRLADMAGHPLDQLHRVHPAHNTMEGATIPLADGYALVSHSHFCGRDCGVTVYMNQKSAAALRLIPVAIASPEIAAWLDDSGSLRAAGLLEVAPVGAFDGGDGIG